MSATFWFLWLEVEREGKLDRREEARDWDWWRNWEYERRWPVAASMRKVVVWGEKVAEDWRRERAYWMMERGWEAGGSGTGGLRLRKVFVWGQNPLFGSTPAVAVAVAVFLSC